MGLNDHLQAQPHAVDPDLQRGGAGLEALDFDGGDRLFRDDLSDVCAAVIVAGAGRAADDRHELARALLEGDSLFGEFRGSGNLDRAGQRLARVEGRRQSGAAFREGFDQAFRDGRDLAVGRRPFRHCATGHLKHKRVAGFESCGREVQARFGSSGGAGSSS